MSTNLVTSTLKHIKQQGEDDRYIRYPGADHTVENPTEYSIVYQDAYKVSRDVYDNVTVSRRMTGVSNFYTANPM